MKELEWRFVWHGSGGKADSGMGIFRRGGRICMDATNEELLYVGENKSDLDRAELLIEQHNAALIFVAQTKQAEIDRLKAENAELKTRFGELLQQEFRGHQLQDRMMFTVKGREIIDWWVALNSQAIAKARGES